MKNIFAKTILRAYASLESMAGQIDDLVYRQALSTHSLKGDCICMSAQRQVEKVVKLMNKKNNLINLKLLTDEVLASLDGDSKILLVDKYVKKEDKEKTISRLEISNRTYFRRLILAEEKFAKGCILRGCDEKWFEENYFDQRWLTEIFDNIKRKAEQNKKEKN